MAEGGALVRCDWVADAPAVTGAASCGVLTMAVQALDNYFDGGELLPVPLLASGSNFRKAVWRGVCAVSRGEVMSYGRLAAVIGMPAAVRAVANAVGANPLSIFIPCHRIVGASSMGGYAGGRSVKKWLLEHELTLVELKHC